MRKWIGLVIPYGGLVVPCLVLGQGEAPDSRARRTRASANCSLQSADSRSRQAWVSLLGGLALSSDGKSLLFGQNELNEFLIMLMKNFR